MNRELPGCSVPLPGVCGILKGKRKFFSPGDDEMLRQLKNMEMPFTWTQIAECMPGFNARQLRERWTNYLSPVLKTSHWTEEEDVRLWELHERIGSRWGVIGAKMGNRAAPDVKNRFQALVNRMKKYGSIVRVKNGEDEWKILKPFSRQCPSTKQQFRTKTLSSQNHPTPINSS
jgi:hypothetical protein